ncbi:MAG: glycosyltransferase [Actinomycetota bacterium]
MSERPLRIGMVCPYGWDIPGGVQMHIRELAEHFIAEGHYVSVIAPVSDEELIIDPWLVSAGRPVPIPFNGSGRTRSLWSDRRI